MVYFEPRTVMHQGVPTPATIMGHLGRGRSADARRELAALLKARPRDGAAWVCAAWIEHDARNIGAMRAATERAAKFGAPQLILDILVATAANASADMELAITRAERATHTSDAPNRMLALTILGESLYFADRIDDLAALLAKSEEFRNEPRGQLLAARVHRRHGRAAEAEQAWRAVFASNASARVRRLAGSELARHLDAQHRYEEAFQAAKEMHAKTGAPFDTGGLVASVESTAVMAARGAFKNLPHADGPLPPTALIASLPRSGTTLVEQMLDRHPGVCGLGESPALHVVANEFTSMGGWPEGVLSATMADLNRLRDSYLAQTRGAREVPPDVMTLDKSVQTWRRLPAMAAALPGAKLIRLHRDPRDTAISVFLSPMDPRTLGWNASLADIKRVIQAERKCVPALIEALKIQAIDVCYEKLVQDPRAHMQAILAFLGLPWHEECLSPEGNRRVAITLSQEQVRRAVNTEGIGRWRNYAQHFDESWEALA